MTGNTAVATATEMQNNFGRYLAIVQEGKEVIVTRNGKEVGRLVPRNVTVSYLTDSLTGVLKSKTTIEDAKAEGLREKYEATD